jgi:hypothetical protein
MHAAVGHAQIRTSFGTAQSIRKSVLVRDSSGMLKFFLKKIFSLPDNGFRSGRNPASVRKSAAEEGGGNPH